MICVAYGSFLFLRQSSMTWCQTKGKVTWVSWTEPTSGYRRKSMSLFWILKLFLYHLRVSSSGLNLTIFWLNMSFNQLHTEASEAWSTRGLWYVSAGSWKAQKSLIITCRLHGKAYFVRIWYLESSPGTQSPEPPYVYCKVILPKVYTEQIINGPSFQDITDLKRVLVEWQDQNKGVCFCFNSLQLKGETTVWVIQSNGGHK